MEKRKQGKTDLEARFYNRRKKLLSFIRNDAALFTSAAEQYSSRDLIVPYRQDSDFYYLTGHREPNSALLLIGNSSGPRSILYLRRKNRERERWDGERLGLKRAKNLFRVDEVRPITRLKNDLKKLLNQSNYLYYGSGSNPEIDGIVFSLFSTRIGPRPDFPSVLADARVLTGEMRFIKDREELRIMKHAAEITARAFVQIAPMLKTVTSEMHAAKLLESYFARFGADQLAFPTIVASGKNATVLHHTPKLQPLWKRELVLIDAGASYRGYSADITRTFPVSGKFTSAQADIYDVVLAAVRSGLRRARTGSSLNAVHSAVVRTITRGLVDLKILKGKVTKNISSGAYQKFFMHRSGHWLGLDTHDIAPLYFSRSERRSSSVYRPFVSGNVFTLEPGLYFDSRDESVPKHFRGIGIRLEEDVAITNNGYDILTSGVPIERDAIEKLIGG